MQRAASLNGVGANALLHSAVYLDHSSRAVLPSAGEAGRTGSNRSRSNATVTALFQARRPAC